MEELKLCPIEYRCSQSNSHFGSTALEQHVECYVGHGMESVEARRAGRRPLPQPKHDIKRSPTNRVASAMTKGGILETKTPEMVTDL